jgi:hypothetical protein
MDNVASFDYGRSRATADRLIRKFGMQGVLRRATTSPTDRPVWVLIVDELPRDQASQLANPTDRNVIMSAVGLDDMQPDNEQDQLVTFVQPPTNPPVEKEVLPFTCPVKKIAPAGITVLYEFTVRR